MSRHLWAYHHRRNTLRRRIVPRLFGPLHVHFQTISAMTRISILLHDTTKSLNLSEEKGRWMDSMHSNSAKHPNSMLICSAIDWITFSFKSFERTRSDWKAMILSANRSPALGPFHGDGYSWNRGDHLLHYVWHCRRDRERHCKDIKCCVFVANNWVLNQFAFPLCAISSFFLSHFIPVHALFECAQISRIDAHSACYLSWRCIFGFAHLSLLFDHHHPSGYFML